jgi:hypothetical protein
MENPFEALQNQLSRIESLMIQILQRELVSTQPRQEQPISIERVAELLDLSVSAVYQNRNIPRHKRDHRIRFFESEILDYIKNGPKEADLASDLITRRPYRKRRRVSS